MRRIAIEYHFSPQLALLKHEILSCQLYAGKYASHHHQGKSYPVLNLTSRPAINSSSDWSESQPGWRDYFLFDQWNRRISETYNDVTDFPFPWIYKMAENIILFFVGFLRFYVYTSDFDHVWVQYIEVLNTWYVVENVRYAHISTLLHNDVLQWWITMQRRLQLVDLFVFLDYRRTRPMSD